MLQPAVLKRSRGQGLQDGQTYSLPPPVGGWNVHDPLAAMPEKDAVVLENFFPRASSVDLRPGCTYQTTGMLAPPKTLLAYNHPASALVKLFAATDVDIYNVTSGAPVVSGTGITSGWLRYTNITTAGGTFLLAVNGVDNLRTYDGVGWTTVTAVSAYAITGIATTQFTNVAVLKKRLWFTAKNSLSVWYLAAGAMSGAATEFPMGQVFSRGGAVVAIASWTVDGGDGSDDYGVFVTSAGEVAIYKGSDPASSTTWNLVGVYYIGEPVGYNCLSKYGGDLLFLCQNGLFPLSKALQSSVINYHSALTTKIDTAFTEAVTAYGGNQGWSIAVYPEGSLVLVNIPVSTTQTIQYAMNSITGAWTMFTGWFANCFEIFQQKLYFASTYDAVAGQGAVKQAWQGLNDCGADIVGKAQSAYTAFRAGSRSKHVSLVRPILVLAQATEIRYSISTDFMDSQSPSVLNIEGSAGGIWGTGRWGTATWGGHGTTTSKQWQTVFSDDGYRVSFGIQLSTGKSTVEWLATDFFYQLGGVL